MLKKRVSPLLCVCLSLSPHPRVKGFPMEVPFFQLYIPSRMIFLSKKGRDGSRRTQKTAWLRKKKESSLSLGLTPCATYIRKILPRNRGKLRRPYWHLNIFIIMLLSIAILSDVCWLSENFRIILCRYSSAFSMSIYSLYIRFSFRISQPHDEITLPLSQKRNTATERGSITYTLPETSEKKKKDAHASSREETIGSKSWTRKSYKAKRTQRDISRKSYRTAQSSKGVTGKRKKRERTGKRESRAIYTCASELAAIWSVTRRARYRQRLRVASRVCKTIYIYIYTLGWGWRNRAKKLERYDWWLEWIAGRV